MSKLPSTFFGDAIETDGVFVLLRHLVTSVPDTTKEVPCLIVAFPGSQPPVIHASAYGEHWRVFMQWEGQCYIRYFKNAEWDVLLPRLGLARYRSSEAECNTGKIEIVEHYVGAVRKAFQTAGLWRRG